MPNFVLSAAHCMVRYVHKYWEAENPRFYVIVAGTTNLWYTPSWQIVTVSAVFPHAGFDFITMANDIGMYKLTRALQLTPYVSYAPLPLAVDDSIYRKKNQICSVIGWGKTTQDSSVLLGIKPSAHARAQ
ncbi:mast cell protease 8-like [Venturia canescens]|uniref:mast cell protease 8-like n=1 Tax=Venturia canescens TaxID=32260 RepID=UPI001C9CE0E0|nr:mast cell protease 8-like [Venturia canescens]